MAINPCLDNQIDQKICVKMNVNTSVHNKVMLTTAMCNIRFDLSFSEPTPGLFGLYVSCIMSATLSTLSSGMNSMAAAIYEDFLKLPLDGRVTDYQATLLNKVTATVMFRT